jgi:hypothetical protein
MFAVAVVVVMILIIISAALYVQMGDYHDAKYRAQFVIVDGMVTDVAIIGEEMRSILDGSTSNDDRNLSAHVGEARLQSVWRAAEELSAMYRGDQERFQTFDRLRYAIQCVGGTLHMCAADGWRSPSWDVTLRDYSANISALETALAKGIDPDRNAWTDPYSLVNRMDLQKILWISLLMVPQPIT